MKKKIINGLARIALAGAIAGTVFGCTSNEYKTDCKTFQGYNLSKADGETFLVFDDKSLEQRKGNPEYVTQGNPKELGLKIGSNYILTVKKGTFNERAISAERCYK